MDDYGLQASPIIQASIRITAVCYSHLITKLIIDEYHKLKPSTEHDLRNRSDSTKQ